MSSDQIKKRIEEIQALEANPYPTPPVGTSVVWFQGAKRNKDRPYEDARAAVVSAVEGPGKVTLFVMSPFMMPVHKKGCLYCEHPIHQQRHNAVSVDTGSWDYPEGTKPSKQHFDLHLKELAKQMSEAKSNLALNESVKAKA